MDGHVLKCDDCHARFSPDGWVYAREDGLFQADMRFLSRYRWLLGSLPWVPLHVDAGSGDALRGLYGNDPGSLPGLAPNDLLLEIRRELTPHGWIETLTVHSHADQACELPLSLEVAADFSDLFAIRGETRYLHPARPFTAGTDGTWQSGCRGLDGKQRAVQLNVNGAEAVPAAGTAWLLPLKPRQSRQVRVEILLSGDHRPPLPASAARERTGTAALAAWLAAGTQAQSGLPAFARWLERGLADLHLLRTEIVEGVYMAAGLPWYQAPFGRDMLVTALLALPVRVDLAKEALLFLARHQGQNEDARREEQPGRILHELRRGELAGAGIIPHTPYFGSIDSTLLFLWLAGEYHRWTADDELIEHLQPALAAAQTWLEEKADSDGDGLIEYAQREGAALTNQGWKDSRNAIVHGDGRPAEGPIALIDVQAYAYAANCALAYLARARGDSAAAAIQEAQATARRKRIHERYWQDDQAILALALDGAKQPVRSVTSNPGHALWAGLLDTNEAARMAARLLQPDMLGRWGLRTLSAQSPAFNPFSYHNGSIWPHDTAIAALGLARHGLRQEAFTVFSRLLAASQQFPLARLPELYAGVDAPDRPLPYPAACAPQAWAAAAPLSVITAILAPDPNASANSLTLRPLLPPWLDTLSLRTLTVGRSQVDLTLARDRSGRTRVAALTVTGTLQVQVEDGSREVGMT